MHATYLFRAKTDDIDETVSRFESWIAEWGDENNWWELLYAVNSKGQKRILVRDLDWKDRAEGLLENYPTVGDMKRFAWMQMAYDSEVFDELCPTAIPGKEVPEDEKKWSRR